MKKLFIVYYLLFSSMLLCLQIPNNHTPIKYEVIKETFSPNIQFFSDQLGFYNDSTGESKFFYDERRQHETSRDDVTLRLHFDGGIRPMFLIMNEEFSTVSFEWDWISYNLIDVTLPPGVYDIYIIFDDDAIYKFVADKLNTLHCSNSSYIHRYFYASDAIHMIEVYGCDIDGMPIYPDDRYSANFLCYLSEKPHYFYLGTYENYMFVSDFDEELVLSISESQYTAENIFKTQYGPFINPATNLNLSNEPEDYVAQHIEMLIPEINYEPKICIIDFSWFFDLAGNLGYFGFDLIDDIFEIQSDLWEIDLYMMEHQQNSGGLTTGLSLIDYEDPFNALTVYQVAPFHCREEAIGSFWNVPYNGYDYLSPEGETLQFGNYPSYFLSFFRFNENTLDFIPYSMRYNNEMLEREWDDDWYQLFDSMGNLVYEGLIDDLYNLYVSPDVYTLEIYDYELNIAGLNGTANLETIFDFTQECSNPPTVTSLKIVDSNGIPNHWLDLNEVGNIIISASDVEYSDNVFTYNPVVTAETEMFFKLHGEEVWQVLNWQFIAEFPDFNWNNGKFFSADLSPLTQIDSVAYDLQFYFEDSDGNSCQWSLSPAFVVGNFNAVETEDILPQSFPNLINHPNPFNPSTTISFSLNTETAENTELVIYNLKGQKVKQLYSDQLSAGQHTMVWNGTDQAGHPVSSGIYFCKLKSGNTEISRKMLLLK